MRKNIDKETAKVLLDTARLEANTARLNLAAKLLERWL